MYLNWNQSITLRCEYFTNGTANLEIWKRSENGTDSILGGLVSHGPKRVNASLEISVENLYDGVGQSNSIVTFCRVIPYINHTQSDPRDYNFTRYELRNETAGLDVTTTIGDFNITILL